MHGFRSSLGLLWQSRYRWVLYLFMALGTLLLIVIVLPLPRLSDPQSTVLLAKDGSLLGAHIADDGQWRFASTDSISPKFSACITNFEDRWFWYHPGVNPLAIGRALWQNIREGRVVSGASTLTMQLVRLSNHGKARTLGRKILEMAQALKLELWFSKEEILRMYAAHAPFGGNVVGLEAASWRYFGCPSNELSWGESAGLAVLPNAPSLIYPGKNEHLLKAKRDGLLHTLLRRGSIDSLTFILASDEPLPGRPLLLPRMAPHLLDRSRREHPAQTILSTIDPGLQATAQRICREHIAQLKQNHIHNIAAVIADLRTGNVLAYIGNADWEDPEGGAVDMVSAARSSGSILKPFLYAGMLDEGRVMPHSLVPDLPIHFAGYSPKNFDQSFRGVVPASQALSRSLNLPAVWMLREYHPGKFLRLLQGLGFSTFRKTADHYGLSLILGGGETRLDELVAVYASLGRILTHYNETKSYTADDIKPLGYISGETMHQSQGKGILRAAAIYSTLEALLEVNRPESEAGWRHLSSSGRMAFKTGTSFGFRDAWAIGMNTEYVIGVWVGNADGEGRPMLTGASAAAPVLFDLFHLLRGSDWFAEPLEEMEDAAICRNSGFRASMYCDSTDTLRVPRSCLATSPCPYHRRVHLDATGNYRVNMSCCPPEEMRSVNWFILPPAMAWYFRNTDASYSDPPPYRMDCTAEEGSAELEFIYPGPDLMVYLPGNMSGVKEEVVFEAAHRNAKAKLFWHLDDIYLGSTEGYHQLAASPSPGKHTLVIVDEAGNTMRRRFRVVE